MYVQLEPGSYERRQRNIWARTQNHPSLCDHQSKRTEDYFLDFSQVCMTGTEQQG